MRGRVIRIERVSSRSGAFEEPMMTAKGYQLADPVHGQNRHHAEHAIYVQTLDEAAALIDLGYSLCMGAKGKPESMIALKSLRVLREGDLSFA
ncbi:MAG: hypothetical protein C0436_03655 [Alphaproteobacteria bacterium]|nr:hypothetical protein [Alphaproteobacteria bacterium]